MEISTSLGQLSRIKVYCIEQKTFAKGAKSYGVEASWANASFFSFEMHLKY
jgi:hypothetical protein